MIKTLNRKYFVFIGIIIFTLLILTIFIFIIMPREKPVELIKEDAFYGMLENGDIICRLGDRLWSQIFKDFSADDKRFSHIGIIRIIDEHITVIHAEGTTKPEKDFVKEESINDFLKVAREIGVYRIMNLDGNKISGMAMEYINVPFDWKFDMSDKSELYCTELLYIILKQLMPAFEFNTVYIKELGRNIIPIDSISNSEYFSEIYFSGNKVN